MTSVEVTFESESISSQVKLSVDKRKATIVIRFCFDSVKQLMLSEPNASTMKQFVLKVKITNGTRSKKKR